MFAASTAARSPGLRKNRPLAEAAALVVLSKKLNAYFDPDGVGEEDKDSDK